MRWVLFSAVALAVGCKAPAAQPLADARGLETGDAPGAAKGDGASTGVSQPRASASGSDDGILHARPYGMKVPRSYDPAKPAPLVLALHPYGGAGGPYFVDSWHLDDLAEKKGILLVFPTGTIERSAERRFFWNATDSCCNFFGSDVDDVAYLDAVLDDVIARYAVDKTRIYAVGFSNGGFMSHRLACDRANRFAAIVSMGGATFLDPSRCAQSQPVALLEVHATADAVVPYAGGALPFAGAAAVPSAKETAARTAAANHCKTTQSSAGPAVDLDPKVPGAETTRTRFDACPANAAVELWTVVGGEHVMRIPDAWPELLWSFLEKQKKPSS